MNYFGSAKLGNDILSVGLNYQIGGDFAET